MNQTEAAVTWVLRVWVPVAAAPVFEAALAGLGGAVTSDLPDGEGLLPLSCYMEGKPSQAALVTRLATAALAAKLPFPPYSLEALADRDWVAEAESALPPLSVGRFFVYGGHVVDQPGSAALRLRVDAGLAFGTGRHETTRGCLLAMQVLARRHRFRSILDMGCGSGILAMAAAKLWPARILAVDNDPVAVRTACDNARLNAVGHRIRITQGDGYRSLRPGQSFDLILANILARPLCAMAPDMARSLAANGYAVISGILLSQQRAVLSRHASHGLFLAGRILDGDWATLILSRRRLAGG